MTAPALSLTESQTLQALGTFLTGILASGTTIVVGEINRVASPNVPNYVVMTPISDVRLSTNEDTYFDGGLANPVVPGTLSMLMPAQVTIQIDVHGPLAHDNATTIMALLRSTYAVTAFQAVGFDVTPLNTSDPHQVPFLNEGQQTEIRWVIDAVLQCNPVLTVAQQFGAAAVVKPVSVDAAYPANLRALRIQGSQIVYTATGQAAKLRGWSVGLWGTMLSGDAAANVTQGATMVRIPLRWWGLYATGYESRDDTQAQTACIDIGHLMVLDSMMASAAAAGLQICLFIDSNCGQDGTQSGEPAYCDPLGQYPNGHNFWTDPAERAKFINVWKFIAARYANNPYWSIAEILPEPDPEGFSAKDISSFYQQVIQALRPIVPGMLYLIGGASYDPGNLANALLPGAPDVIYTADLYMHTGGTQSANEANWSSRLAECTAFVSTYGVPVFIQQTGVQYSNDPSQVYTNYMLSALNAAGLGWAWWMYRDNNAGGFGAWYLDTNGDGGWTENVPVLTTVASYLAAS